MDRNKRLWLTKALRGIFYFIVGPMIVVTILSGIFYFIILFSCITVIVLIRSFLKEGKIAWYTVTIISLYSLIVRLFFFIIIYLNLQEALQLQFVSYIKLETNSDYIAMSPLEFAYQFVSRTFNLTINTQNQRLGLFSFVIFLILAVLLYYPPTPSTAVFFALRFLLPSITSIIFETPIIVIIPVVAYPLLFAFDIVYIYFLFRYGCLRHHILSRYKKTEYKE